MHSAIFTLPCRLHLGYLSSVSQDSKLAVPFSSFISLQLLHLLQHRRTDPSMHNCLRQHSWATPIAVFPFQLAKNIATYTWAPCITASFPFSLMFPAFLQQFHRQQLEVFAVHSPFGSGVQPSAALRFSGVVRHLHDHKRAPQLHMFPRSWRVALSTKPALDPFLSSYTASGSENQVNCDSVRPPFFFLPAAFLPEVPDPPFLCASVFLCIVVNIDSVSFQLFFPSGPVLCTRPG